MITWIKMTSELEEKPEVLEMSAILGLPKLHIVGCLWRVWTWFDLHSKDGNARVTDTTERTPSGGRKLLRYNHFFAQKTVTLP